MKKVSPGINIFILLLIPWMVYGQWPVCDLYSWDLSTGNQKIEKPTFLNGFHLSGYNNQPAYFDKNEWLITTTKSGHGTDILWLNIKKREFHTFTNTKNSSEFSPQRMPDMKNISTVRIEQDGKTQTLWSYPIDRSHYGKNLLPQLDNIGYYTWIDSLQVALFLVDSVQTLALANIETQKVTFLQEGIGRCLKSKEGFLFFTKIDDSGLKIVKKYDLKNQIIESLFALPMGSEDFEILDNHDILYATGSKLYIAKHGNFKNPELVTDFKKFGLNNIKRLAVQNNTLIFVNQPISHE